MMGLLRWTKREFGYPCHWTAYQFDSAVLWFGSWVEGKLQETTDKGKPKYTIRELVYDDAPLNGAKGLVARLRAAKMVVSKKAK